MESPVKFHASRLHDGSTEQQGERELEAPPESETWLPSTAHQSDHEPDAHEQQPRPERDRIIPLKLRENNCVPIILYPTKLYSKGKDDKDIFR